MTIIHCYNYISLMSFKDSERRKRVKYIFIEFAVLTLFTISGSLPFFLWIHSSYYLVSIFTHLLCPPIV